MKVFFFSSRRRHTRLQGDWSSDVCSSDLRGAAAVGARVDRPPASRRLRRRRYGAARVLLSRSHGDDVSHVGEIGRASCRERGEISVGGGSLKKKKNIIIVDVVIEYRNVLV